MGHLSTPKTVSIQEAAQRLRVSDKTVRRWIKTGKLPATQESGPYGFAWRIPEVAIHTAQQVIAVVPIDRALDPRTLGMVIAQAVSQETQGLVETVNALKTQVEQLSRTLEQLEERRTQAEVSRDERVVQMIRAAVDRNGPETQGHHWWWPWNR